MKCIRDLSLFLLVHLAALGLATSALGAPITKKSTASQGAEDKADSETSAKIIQKIISSIDKSSCDFNFEVETKDEDTTQFNDLDIKCTMKMNADIRYEIFDDGSEEKENATAEKFKTEVILKTKGLIIDMSIQKKMADGKLMVRFYSGFNPSTQEPVEKPLTATLATRLNKNLLTIYLNSIDLQTKDDPKNPKLMNLNGSCKSYKEMYNFMTAKPELKEASCYVQGTYEEGIGPRLKAGYKNTISTKQEVLP